MKKKLLSVLMVLCLILAMAPAAFAEGDGDTVYTEWTSTTSLPTASGAYKLMNDVSMNSSVSYSGRSIVLDLNGHSITFTNATKNSAAFYFYGNSSLTLEDSVGGGKISNDDSCGNYLVYINGGNFTMTGGIIENAKSGGTALYINSDCQATISGGEVLNSASRGEALFINSSATVEMNQGTIKNTVDGGNAVYVNGSASFAMSGGSVIQESTYDSAAAIDANNSVVAINISGGSIISNSKGIKAYFTPVTVTGGNFDTDGYTFFTRNLSVEPDSDSDVSVTSDTGVIYSLADSANKISAGTFTAPYIVAPYTNSDISTLEISGGTFNGLTKVEAQDTNTDITITSGTFTNSEDKGCEDVNNYIPDDIAMKVDPDTGEIVVDNETSIATVDGIGYDTFAAALNALKDNSTLTLLQSVEVTSQIAIDEDNVTFDGGGFTISAGDGFPASTDLILVTGDNVTVKNVILDGATHYGIQFYEAGNATIQDVTAQNNTSNGIHINASTVKAAGTITLSNNGSYGMNLINVGFGSGINSAPGCSFDITGATLVGVDAIYSDSSDVTNSGSYGITITDGENEYVAVKDSAWPNFFVPQAVAEESAKITVTNGDKVTYYYNESSLQDAVAAADNGSTITLAPGTYDLGDDNGIVLNKKLTIQGSGADTVIKGTGTANYGNGLFTFTGGSEGSVLKDLTINYTATGAQRAAVYFNDGFTGGSADNVTKIQNVDFVGGSLDNEKACGITSSYITGGYIEVSGCSFKNFAYGMYFNRVHDLTIEGNTIDGTRYNAINIAGDGDECSNIVIRDNTLTNISYANYDSDIYSSGINIGLAVSDVNIESNDITMLNGKEPINIVVAEDNTSKVTVTYTVNGSDYVVIVADEEDGKATYTEPADPAAPQGYKFDGWAYTGAVSVSGNTVTLTVGDTYEYTFAAKFSAIEVDPPEKPYHPSRPVGPTYDIDVVDADNGSVSANLSNASEGSTIRLTVEPDEGYELGSLTVTGPDGRVEVTRVNASTYRFTMPDGDVTVRATFVSEGLPFTDVSSSAWYYDAVSYVYANGLMDGVSSTQFNPDGTMTRAMVWAILARIDGQTVTGDGWIETAREWAVAEGVSDGENANGAVTREQLVTMLWRYAGEPEGTAPLSAWSDAGSVSDWAAEAMSWAIDNSVITGMSADTLAPQGSATRAQCAAILMRCADLLA